MRAIKLIVALVLAGAVALVGYAYLADMRPEQREITRPLDIPGQSAPSAPPAPAQGAADGN